MFVATALSWAEVLLGRPIVCAAFGLVWEPGGCSCLGSLAERLLPMGIIN